MRETREIIVGAHDTLASLTNGRVGELYISASPDMYTIISQERSYLSAIDC